MVRALRLEALLRSCRLSARICCGRVRCSSLGDLRGSLYGGLYGGLRGGLCGGLCGDLRGVLCRGLLIT